MSPTRVIIDIPDGVRATDVAIRMLPDGTVGIIKRPIKPADRRRLKDITDD